MKRLKAFDRITTPESWKRGALEHRAGERAKLKTWQNAAIIGVTAVTALVMLVAPSLLLRIHPRIDEVEPISRDGDDIDNSEEEASTERDVSRLPKTEEKIEGGGLDADTREMLIKQMNFQNDLVVRCIVLDSDEEAGTITVGIINTYNIFNKGEMRTFKLSHQGIDYTGGQLRGDLTGNIDKDFGDEVSLGVIWNSDGSIDTCTGFLNLGPTTDSTFKQTLELAEVMAGSGKVDATAQELICAHYKKSAQYLNQGWIDTSQYSMKMEAEGKNARAFELENISSEGNYTIGCAFKLQSRSGLKIDPTLSEAEVETAELYRRVADLDIDLGQCGSGHMRITTDNYLCRFADAELIGAEGDDTAAYLLVFCDCDDQARQYEDRGGDIIVEIDLKDQDGDEGILTVTYDLVGMNFSNEPLDILGTYFDGEIEGYTFNFKPKATIHRGMAIFGTEIYTMNTAYDIEIRHEDGSLIHDLDYSDPEAYSEALENGRFPADSYYIYPEPEDCIYENELMIVRDYEKKRQFVIGVLKQPDSMIMGMGSYGSDMLQEKDSGLIITLNYGTNLLNTPQVLIWELDWDKDLSGRAIRSPMEFDDPESEYYRKAYATLSITEAQERIPERVVEEP